MSLEPSVNYVSGLNPAGGLRSFPDLPLMAGLMWLCISLDRVGLAVFAGAMGGLAVIMIGPSRPRRFDPLAPPADLLPE